MCSRFVEQVALIQGLLGREQIVMTIGLMRPRFYSSPKCDLLHHTHHSRTCGGQIPSIFTYSCLGQHLLLSSHSSRTRPASRVWRWTRIEVIHRRTAEQCISSICLIYHSSLQRSPTLSTCAHFPFSPLVQHKKHLHCVLHVPWPGSLHVLTRTIFALVFNHFRSN